MKNLSIIAIALVLLAGIGVSAVIAEEKGNAAEGKVKYDQF